MANNKKTASNQLQTVTLDSSTLETSVVNSVPVEIVTNTAFRTQYNTYHEEPFSNGEVNTLPSETMPDQALSVEQIIRDYVNGYGLPQDYRYFDDPEELDQSSQDEIAYFEKLDDFDQEIYLRERRKKLQEFQKQYQKQASSLNAEGASPTKSDGEAIDRPKESEGQNTTKDTPAGSSNTPE